MNLRKQFHVREQWRLQANGSFSNVFNHPNYGLPARNLSASNFGRITSTQGAEAGGSRNLQVGLRLIF